MGFTRKLHIAFGAMVLLTLAIAWYFFDSARWFARDTQELSQASSVLSGYQEVARLTYGTLQGLESAMRLERPGESVGVAEDSDAARGALAALRLVLEAEAGDEPAAFDETTFAELQATVESIFRTALLAEAALQRGQVDLAREEFSRLDSQGLVGRFEVLVEQAVAEREAILERQQAQAVSLADYIARLLPVVMVLFVVLAAFVAWRISRSLSRSLGTLHEAAREYGEDNLQHTVPNFRDWEFQALGEAFNQMAQHMAETRNQLRDSNVRLEAKVDERTRALQSSNEKLARVDEHRRKLLAEISHEFRTPLTVIKGESEIALRGKNQGMDDYREAFRRIVDTADHATGLVEDLLFIVRADAGEPKLRFEKLDVSELLERVCTEFRAKAEAKELKIRHLGAAEEALLIGDPRRLRQVFAILLDNALRYSHPGRDIEVVSSVEGQGVRVEVRDRGIGLSDDEAQRAFDRFFRGRQALAHAEHGTGLGLPVAKAIVEAHGGKISLRARDGEGAVATVELPLDNDIKEVA